MSWSFTGSGAKMPLWRLTPTDLSPRIVYFSAVQEELAKVISSSWFIMTPWSCWSLSPIILNQMNCHYSSQHSPAPQRSGLRAWLCTPLWAFGVVQTRRKTISPPTARNWTLCGRVLGSWNFSSSTRSPWWVQIFCTMYTNACKTSLAGAIQIHDLVISASWPLVICTSFNP